jgi:hypothetical protein
LTPGADGCVVAGGENVGQDEQRAHHLVGVARAGDGDECGVGQRHPHGLTLAAVPVHREEAAVHACRGDPVLTVRAAAVAERKWRDHKIAPRERGHLATNVLDDANELVADRARLKRGFTAVVPRVRPADAGDNDPHDGVGGLPDGGVRPVARGDVAGFVKNRGAQVLRSLDWFRFDHVVTLTGAPTM